MKQTCCLGCVFWKLKTALMEKVKVKDFPTDINPPFVLQSYWVTTATFSVAKIKKLGQKLSQLKDLSHNCIWREHLELVKRDQKESCRFTHNGVLHNYRKSKIWRHTKKHPLQHMLCGNQDSTIFHKSHFMTFRSSPLQLSGISKPFVANF